MSGHMGCIRLKKKDLVKQRWQNEQNWGCRDILLHQTKDKNSWWNRNRHNVQIWLTTGHCSLFFFIKKRPGEIATSLFVFLFACTFRIKGRQR